MTFSELRDLMLLYAADAVDEREREQVERWLASGDPVAAAVLAEARAMLAQLPLTLDPVEPQPRMWSALEARLTAEPSDAPAIAAAPLRPRGGWRPYAAAAAAAIVASLATYFLVEQQFAQDRQHLALLRDEVVRQEQQLRQVSTQLDAAALTIERYQQELESVPRLETLVAQQTEQLEAQRALVETQRQQAEQLAARLDAANETVELIQSPTLQTVRLAGTDAMPGAEGRMLWDAQLGRLYFAGADFVPPDATQTYQLWFVTDPAGPVSLGTFTVDANGRATYDAPLPDFDATIQLVAVSLEPAGGSPNPNAPSGPVVLAGEAGQAGS